MKKLILVIFICLVPLILMGIDTTGKIETGYDLWQQQMYVKFNIGLPLSIRKTFLVPYFGSEVWLDTAQFQQINSTIISNEYRAGVTLYFSNMYIGYEHNCFHPQNSYRPADWNDVIRFGVTW
jgi:hypothetical protein